MSEIITLLPEYVKAQVDEILSDNKLRSSYELINSLRATDMGYVAQLATTTNSLNNTITSGDVVMTQEQANEKFNSIIRYYKGFRPGLAQDPNHDGIFSSMPGVELTNVLNATTRTITSVDINNTAAIKKYVWKHLCRLYIYNPDIDPLNVEIFIMLCWVKNQFTRAGVPDIASFISNFTSMRKSPKFAEYIKHMDTVNLGLLFIMLNYQDRTTDPANENAIESCIDLMIYFRHTLPGYLFSIFPMFIRYRTNSGDDISSHPAATTGLQYFDKNEWKKAQLTNKSDAIYCAEIGRMRFDTKLVRNLTWLVQLQRIMRVVLTNHLSWMNTPVVRGLRIADPKVTVYIANVAFDE
jgi:hypothetical protein